MTSFDIIKNVPTLIQNMPKSIKIYGDVFFVAFERSNACRVDQNANSHLQKCSNVATVCGCNVSFFNQRLLDSNFIGYGFEHQQINATLWYFK